MQYSFRGMWRFASKAFLYIDSSRMKKLMIVYDTSTDSKKKPVTKIRAAYDKLSLLMIQGDTQSSFPK